jgi:hypothetical protein
LELCEDHIELVESEGMQDLELCWILDWMACLRQGYVLIGDTMRSGKNMASGG